MSEHHRLLGVSDSAGIDEIRTAYRALARKWHPDRFQEGPERIWAEQKMIEINRAYNACLDRCKPDVSRIPGGRFTEVRLLIEAGQLSRARQLMCAMDERGAEWNYHFGTMLFERKDYEKAAVYFSIACRQAPDNETYKKALSAAEGIVNKNRPLLRFKKLLKRKSS